MKDAVAKYIQSISIKFSYEETTEMGYRTDFENLLKAIFEGEKINRFDHDSKSVNGNKPDFVVRKNDIPILYIEAKDIGVSLDKVEKSEQMSRYYGYTNLVLTDYVEFRFYRNGIQHGTPIKIAEINLKNRALKPYLDNYEIFAKTLIDFTKSHKEPIKSGKHLSKIMGGKAQIIRNEIHGFLKVVSEENKQLLQVYETIKRLLVHDLTEDSFADMYAQTLVYGLFAARYYDSTPDTFTRQEARDLIPASNPFLRHFFDHIVGPDFDKRLEYIVDELCEVFSHADVEDLMREYFKKDSYGEDTKGPDPVIHFYEDFLKEYDPELRKKMGAYYTPLPVVNFIVRSVDYLLKKDFGLVNGLTDTSKLENGKHKVQVLDPAVGTGTFISAVIGNIYKSILDRGQKGCWPTYVHNDLLPRIHGFELMMAPYTIAHLKLAMAFKETGFKYFNRRLGIYLTNSLEEALTQQKLFTSFGLADSIVNESKEAFIIKNNTPIMVVVGNPPYSVSSSNKGEWITNLVKDYKKDLNEKNIQPLSDDYIKFIRFAEHFIEKNRSGIIAMITNNSFANGIIHRQMRKHLLETFDDIYIFNLHGSTKNSKIFCKNESDENVFNIQQGVSINIFVRRENVKKGLGRVYYSEIYGKKENKFHFLNENNIKSIKWEILNYSNPHYFFVPKNFSGGNEYEMGFKVDDLFLLKSSGIKTHHDKELVSFDSIDCDFNEVYLYRPFDYRFINYDLKKVERNRFELMKHIINHDNISLITSKQFGGGKHFILLVSNILHDISSQPFAAYYNFPVYLYSEDGTKTLNYKKEIIEKIENIVGKTIPEDIFDYIYAILHSPNYREKYKEFLKIDFPRIPYPKDIQTFKKLVLLGAELRRLHLMESAKLDKYITTYPEDGSNIVEKIIYKEGNIFINEKQYFGKVPEIAWNFYIGGYQPVQKWLKDRKGRELTNEDIEHYQKIIVALFETDKLMKKIGGIGIL
jgi:predicted helicase